MLSNFQKESVTVLKTIIDTDEGHKSFSRASEIRKTYALYMEQKLSLFCIFQIYKFN